MVPDCGLSMLQESGVKGKKMRITYALTINVDGSEKLPPFVIGKAHKPHAFKKKTDEQLSFYYCNNVKAWMTTKLYQEWLSSWDAKLRREHHHILLLQDNFKGHVPPEDLTNITVENFEPNLTAHVQPANAGIIWCFKAHYRQHFIRRAIDRYNVDITLAKIYDINQLQAMQLVAMAWDEVSAETICNCWCKTGILPSSLLEPAPPSSESQDSVVAANTGVTEVLDDIQGRGLLQKKNWVDLDDFVDPKDEHRGLGNGNTDGNIFEAVMKAWHAWEMMEINSGDDVDEDGCNDDVEPVPTLKEVLAASSVMQSFVSNVDEPFACQLEVLLGKLGHHAWLEHSKTLWDGLLTDFFSNT